jgi:hypothetical protein
MTNEAKVHYETAKAWCNAAKSDENIAQTLLTSSAKLRAFQRLLVSECRAQKGRVNSGAVYQTRIAAILSSHLPLMKKLLPEARVIEREDASPEKRLLLRSLASRDNLIWALSDSTLSSLARSCNQTGNGELKVSYDSAEDWLRAASQDEVVARRLLTSPTRLKAFSRLVTGNVGRLNKRRRMVDMSHTVKRVRTLIGNINIKSSLFC